MDVLNILYVHSHDTGRQIQPYGAPVATPHLQALAQDGLLFRQAYAAAPTCSPSRAALLTGQWAHSCGMLGLAHRGFALHDYRKHVVHTLRAAGYFTALFGVQHEARDPAVIGCDQVAALQATGAEVAACAARFLSNTPPRPFFLSVGFFKTHRPFPHAAVGRDGRYCTPPHPLPDRRQVRQDVADFYASVTTLDRQIGEILAALHTSGLADETLLEVYPSLRREDPSSAAKLRRQPN